MSSSSFLIINAFVAAFIRFVINVIYVCRGGILSHSFELEAKVKGPFYGAPAVVTFRIPTKTALQVCHL